MHNEINTYLAPNQVHLICGRSGVGKTHLLFQALNHYRIELDPIAYIATDRETGEYTELFKEGKIIPWPCISLIEIGASMFPPISDERAYNAFVNKRKPVFEGD